jgi:hypothetical protein
VAKIFQVFFSKLGNYFSIKGNMKKYVYYSYFHFAEKNGTHVLAMFVGTIFS